MAAAATNEYRPDYAVPPGSVLEERLAAHDISHAEFARRCGRSPKLISDIVSGKAPIEPKTALQFEKVLGVDADIWLGIEKDYRLHQTRAAEAEAAEAASAWAEAFPIKELIKRGVIGKASTGGGAVSELLSFFGVASIVAWQSKHRDAAVAYRHSPSFKSDRPALAAWLRLAEIEAAKQPCPGYRESGFKKALRQIRGLTCEAVPEALEEARRLCNHAGVALVLVKPLPKTHLSGAAWWLSPRNPVIALSARHKTDDHLWFSLFHEAAHILLHSKKTVFLDGTNGGEDDIEVEANDWAANFLVPCTDLQRFIDIGVYRSANIRQFADEQGVAPGIVVGSLQHRGLLPWNRLNALKARLRWADER